MTAASGQRVPGLAHTRLSIIDVGGSRQPMATADDTAHLVLERRHTQLSATAPPTALTVAHHARHASAASAVRQRGPAAVPELRGQFAYALRDCDTGETHFFRDRLGILPLCYCADDSVFAFASELKALLPIMGAVRVDDAVVTPIRQPGTTPAA